MFSITSSSFSHIFYFSIAITGAIFALLGHFLPGFSISTSAVGQTVRQYVNIIYTPNLNHDGQQYQVQIFSRDPLIIYIRDFLSSDEITHLLNLSEKLYEPSRVYGGDVSSLDPKMRVSERAYMDRKDSVVRRITKRAREFQGWRGNSTFLEPLSVQRYQVDGFYNYHFDWDESLTQGNRVTSFMVYLMSDCIGGGTNFPFLQQPDDTRWCDVIECDEDGKDGYQGVTFKPVVGSAVYWENFHPNGSGHKGVYHAALPVKSGVKVGLNMWSWDTSWMRPEVLIAL